MRLVRTIGRDIVSALAVLVLVLLSVAPHSTAMASGYSAMADHNLHSVCGDIGAGGAEHHVPCHACRVTPVVLPAAPCSIEPAYVSLETITVPALLEVGQPAPIHSPQSPRAPPSVV